MHDWTRTAEDVRLNPPQTLRTQEKNGSHIDGFPNDFRRHQQPTHPKPWKCDESRPPSTWGVVEIWITSSWCSQPCGQTCTAQAACLERIPCDAPGRGLFPGRRPHTSMFTHAAQEQLAFGCVQCSKKSDQKGDRATYSPRQGPKLALEPSKTSKYNELVPTMGSSSPETPRWPATRGGRIGHNYSQ